MSCGVTTAQSAGVACDPAIDVRKRVCLYFLVQLDRGYGSVDWATRVRRHVLIAGRERIDAEFAGLGRASASI